MRTSFKRKMILLLVVLGGAALMLFGGSRHAAFFWAGLGVMTSGWLATFRVFRCPHCGAYLGRVYGKATSCPACGKEID